MEKINFKNKGEAGAISINANNLNLMQDNVENSFKSSMTTSDKDTYNCNYINNVITNLTTDWVNATLENNWQSMNLRPLRYKKINSVVFIEGTITGGAYNAGTRLFVLPKGYRCGNNYSKFICTLFQNNAVTPVSIYTNLSGGFFIDVDLAGNEELSLNISFVADR